MTRKMVKHIPSPARERVPLLKGNTYGSKDGGKHTPLLHGERGPISAAGIPLPETEVSPASTYPFLHGRGHPMGERSLPDES